MNIEALQNIVVSVTCEHSVECVLATIVQGLAADPNTALARIWLVGPGDICESCVMREECPDQTQCLHLVASAGHSIEKNGPAWNNIEGAYRRFPFGVRKVGKIASSRAPALLEISTEAPPWMREPAWAVREKLRSFAGQPLIFRGEVLGVLAVFSRISLDDQALTILRAFAEQAAASIANAQAFEEIKALREQLELENAYLREEVDSAHDHGDIVGASPALQKVLHQIELVAKTDSSVLLFGESGTGKELVARAIHEGSTRSERPMIRVNCASIPRELFESEFFGHIKGAFTGAIRDRTGRFALADGGTLFLDEVGEIPLELQSKLLRVLQEGQFERLGDEVTRRVDVRIIAATNRDLKEDVAAKRFRQDLYYRLSVFPVEIPPLRERVEDIPVLAMHFLTQVCTKLGMPQPVLKQRHVMALQQYDWPGNIRELQNVIERAVITAESRGLRFDLETPALLQESPDSSKTTPDTDEAPDVLTDAEFRQLERDNIVNALHQVNWKVGGADGAAELLGMKSTTLASRIIKMGIERGERSIRENRTFSQAEARKKMKKWTG